jgi:nitrate/TMAO reductase-like tetraheme cytochrome c subunit
MPDAPSLAQPRSFKRHFQNWLSWAGILLAAAALFAFVLLFAIDSFASAKNPYVGILGYVVAPFFFLLGLALTLLGAILHRRAERRARHLEEKQYVLQIDLSRKRDRRILALFAFGAVGFLFLTALGSYETYQLTESVEFCGKTCHLPMQPQFVAYQHAAHASVDCVACHVGPGAAAYFKTKANGVKQLYHTVLGDFDRPIYVTAETRPEQEICLECHSPKRYIGTIDRTYQHYLSDEANTPFAVRLLLNVGGGEPSRGPVGGIHWHMNIANKVEYIPADSDPNTIPWVRVTDAQGHMVEYRTEDFKGEPSQEHIRRMDCLDCHSRPAHDLMPPNEAVDVAIAAGRIDPKIPFAKAKVVAALTQPYTSKPQALQAIATSLHAAYPDPKQADPLVAEAEAIYQQNFFPEMKTDWRTYANNIGHKDWNGCFRCHDGNHKTADGSKTISASDCNSCHLILAQGSGEQLKKLNADGYTFFHIDSEFSDFSCSTCHTGGPQK